MPAKKPSTTVRARICRFLIRINVAGSMKLVLRAATVAGIGLPTHGTLMALPKSSRRGAEFAEQLGNTKDVTIEDHNVNATV
jgi:hypothetical protein